MKKFLKKIRAGGNDSSGPYSAPSDDGSGAETGTRLFWNSCNVNCGGLCLLRTHVRDGKIVRIETDNLGDDSYGNHQVRACLRGRSMRKRVYGPERLKYPMKRVGRRGEGNFRRISWDEAFDLIAGKMKHVKEKYGDEAFYITYATGSIDAVMSKSWPPSPIARLMNCYGGYLNYDNTYSYSQISTALTYTYGRGWVSGNSLSDIINSRLVVFFGNNPAETRMSGGGMVHDLLVAKKKGNAKVVMVDPRYNDTAVAVADEWVPIRPGTDAAFVSGLAHVLITENLVDEDFLAKFCVGYDEEHTPEGIPPGNSYKSYILGLGRDKTPKTPEWASRITGIPLDVIIRLGREIGQAKPAYISQGWGAQRHSNGEQTARAICMLSILTGNVDWLKEVAPQQLWINPLDARERGIRHGDIVLVYNNRGECIVPTKVTERILPGVLSLPQGAWFKPDKSGLDRGGCANTLTSLRPSPLSKGNPQHSNLVQVKKYEGSIRI